MKAILFCGCLVFPLSLCLSFAGGKTLKYKDVKPIFAKSCLPCHSGSKPAHGLNLTTYQSILKGDGEGPVIKKKSSRKSRLARVLHGSPQLMPPGGELPPASIQKIERWIDAGALEK